MRRKTAIVIGVSGAALALTASSAFTAGGVTLASGLSNGFLGGSVEQTVVGTEISAISYTPTAGALTQIDITFTDTNSDGKTPTVVIDDGGTATATWTCTAIASKASSCTPGTGTKPLTASIAKVTFTVV